MNADHTYLSQAALLKLPDAGDVHGGLLALTELAAAFRDSPHSTQLEPERRKVRARPAFLSGSVFTSSFPQIFAALSTVSLTMIQSSRQELIAAAACNLIASAISLAETQHAHTTVPHWRQVVDSGLKSKAAAVQEAAAGALAAVSRLVDCSAVLQRLVKEFEGGSPQMQQSLARVLGVLDYSAYEHGIEDAVRCLLRLVDRKVHGATPGTHANWLMTFGRAEPGAPTSRPGGMRSTRCP